MKRSSRKSCFVLLCFFLFSILPMSPAGPPASGVRRAEAAGGTSSGEPWDGITSANPLSDGSGGFLISTPAQLAGMRDWVNAGINAEATYRLAADIDLGGRQWTPIGVGEFGSAGSDTSSPTFASGDAKPFKGRFDGAGYSVGNFYIVSDDYGLDVAGLFGVVSGDAFPVEIRSLDVDGFVISVDRNRVNGRASFARDSYVIAAGGLAGVLQNASVSDCRAWGRIAARAHEDGLPDPSASNASMSAAYAGGICGFVAGMDTISTFAGCYAEVDVETSSTAVESSGSDTERMQMSVSGGQIGFVYEAALRMDDCHAAGDVNATAATAGSYSSYPDILSIQAGGLVGAFSYGSYGNAIRRSGATGAVSSDVMAGGLVGYAFDSLEIEDCRAAGSVDAGLIAGGLVGEGDPLSITGSAASGAVRTAGQTASNRSMMVGGLVGNSEGGRGIARSFAIGDVSSGIRGLSGGLVGYLIGKTGIRAGYATGSVSAGNAGSAGGIVGWLEEGAAVRYSYAIGPVAAGAQEGVDTGNSGGVAGSLYGARNPVSIDKSYATGDVSVGSNGKVGGIAGAKRTSSSALIQESYAYGSVRGGSGSTVGGVVGWNEGDIRSSDWFRSAEVNAGVSNGIGHDGSFPPNSLLAIHIRSMDSMDVTQVDRFRLDQGWTFNLDSPEEDKWGYTSLDNEIKPVLGAFFRGDFNTLAPDMVALMPDVLSIRAGETKYVRLAAGGYEKDATRLAFAGDLSAHGIRGAQHTSSKDILVVTAAPDAATASLAVSVDIEIAGYPQAGKRLRLEVTDAVEISPDSLPTAIVGDAYDERIAAAGGRRPYSYGYVLTNPNYFPPGLSFDADGRIHGTPTGTNGSYTFNATVTDSSSESDSKSFTLAVNRPLSLDQASPPPYLISGNDYPNVPVAYVASGTGTGVYTEVSADNLPPGMNIAIGADGRVYLSGASDSGLYRVAVRVTDSSGRVSSLTVPVRIVDPLAIAWPDTLPEATVGERYEAAISVDGGSGVYPFFSLSGDVPAGLMAGSAGGKPAIVGVPSAEARIYRLRVVVSDDLGQGAFRDYDLALYQAFMLSGDVGIPYGTLPYAMVNRSYDVRNARVEAVGGKPPYRFALSGDAQLPEGLLLNPDGTITGMPLSADRYRFGVVANDNAGREAAKPFEMTVYPDLKIVTERLRGGKAGEAYRASLDVTGGSGDRTFRLTPEGSVFSISDTGLIEGMPMQAGSYAISVSVSDDTIWGARRDYDITVVDDQWVLIQDLLDELNKDLSGNVGLFTPSPDLGTGITAVRPSGPIFQIKEHPTAEIPNGYYPYGNSFTTTLPLDEANGDILALTYTVDLSHDSRFAGWGALNESRRMSLLAQSGALLVYEYDDPAKPIARLMEEQSLTTWWKALTDGILALTDRGFTVCYAVTDAAGSPYVAAGVLVIPDGAADRVIRDPMWFLLPSVDDEYESSDGGCGDCNMGAGSILFLFLMPVLTLRRRR